VYVTSQFDPGFTFTLGRGWQLLSPESSTFLTFLHGDDPNSDPILAFLRPTRVVDPRRRYLKEDVPQDALLPPPKDLAAWIARHPLLDAGDPKSRVVGGVDATQVDTVLRSGYRNPGCARRCVMVFAPNPDLVVTADVGQKVRNIVVDVGRVPIVIGILAPEERFEEHVAVGERVLATLRFSPP